MSQYLAELRQLVGHRPLMLSSAATVVMERGRVLVGRHTLHDLWVVPGGAIDPGETPAQAAAREMLEETGYEVEIVDLLGVFGGTPEHRIEYANGDVVDYILVVMAGHIVGGEPAPDPGEISELTWMSLEQLREAPSAPWMIDIIGALGDPPRRFRR
jgi:8-oxo-dGTP pyrophosphatase MutT (NUDIX family)